MKANELRIGNWYMYADNDGIVHRTIKEIKYNEFGFIGDYDGVNFGICKPIPLTEEWVLKFGFECIFTHDDHHYFLESLDLGLDRSYQPFGIGKYKVEFKYVHQLQNLYFALTGEELTFKSE